LAEKIYSDASLVGAYNFGPEPHEAATVQKVIELANQVYGSGSVLWGDGTEGPHEAGLLSLEISKAREALGIAPKWDLTQTVKRTMGWYKQQKTGVNARLLCDADIAAFSDAQEA
jgi:CDP-glucose 4,6-dehydratase